MADAFQPFANQHRSRLDLHLSSPSCVAGHVVYNICMMNAQNEANSSCVNQCARFGILRTMDNSTKSTSTTITWFGEWNYNIATTEYMRMLHVRSHRNRNLSNAPSALACSMHAVIHTSSFVLSLSLADHEQQRGCG